MENLPARYAQVSSPDKVHLSAGRVESTATDGPRNALDVMRDPRLYSLAVKEYPQRFTKVTQVEVCAGYRKNPVSDKAG